MNKSDRTDSYLTTRPHTRDGWRFINQLIKIHGRKNLRFRGRSKNRRALMAKLNRRYDSRSANCNDFGITHLLQLPLNEDITIAVYTR